jgi:hypothetical protein
VIIPTAWWDANLPRIIYLCQQQPRTLSVEEAIRRIVEVMGLEVTAHSFRSALNRRRLPSPGQIMAGAEIPERWRYDSPQLRQESPQLPATVAENIQERETEPQQISESAGDSSEEPDDPEEEAASYLLALLRRGSPRSRDDLCNAMDCSPRKLDAAIGRAEEDGAQIEREPGGMVTLEDMGTANTKGETYVEVGDVEPGNLEHVMVAITADLHAGHGQSQPERRRAFCQWAYQQGVRVFLDGGDLTDGPPHIYKAQPVEQVESEFEGQIDIANKATPEMEGAQHYLIPGNHDYYWEAHNAGNPQAMLAKHRADITYLVPEVERRRGRTTFRHVVRIGSLRIEIVHPSGSMPKRSIDLRLMDFVESYQRDCEPHYLALAHYHSFGQVEYRGVVGFYIPAFIPTTPLFERNAKPCKMGGLILEAWLDDKGGVVRDRLWREYPDPLRCGVQA